MYYNEKIVFNKEKKEEVFTVLSIKEEIDEQGNPILIFPSKNYLKDEAKKTADKIIQYIFENKIEEIAIISTFNFLYSKDDYFDVINAIKKQKKDIDNEDPYFIHFLFNFFNKDFFLLFNSKNDFFKPIPGMDFGINIPIFILFNPAYFLKILWENFTDLQKEMLIKNPTILSEEKEKSQEYTSEKFPLLFYIFIRSNEYKKEFGIEWVRDDIEWLISKGFNINQIGMNVDRLSGYKEFKTTILHYATTNLENINAVLDKHDTSYVKQKTNTIKLIKKEYFEFLIQIMLENKALTNLLDTQGRTPSHPLIEKHQLIKETNENMKKNLSEKKSERF